MNQSMNREQRTPGSMWSGEGILEEATLQCPYQDGPKTTSCVSHSLFVMAFSTVQCFIAARAYKQHHPSPPSSDSLSGLHILQLRAMETSSFTTVPANQANKTQSSSSTKCPRWFLKPEQQADLSSTWESENNQFSSFTQSCLILCDLMDCSMPGLPVHHQLPEFMQTHVHQVGDAIQPSHPLLSPSPPAFNLSQHQGLFQWVSSLHHVAEVLEFQLQHQSFQWIFGTDFL